MHLRPQWLRLLSVLMRYHCSDSLCIVASIRLLGGGGSVFGPCFMLSRFAIILMGGGGEGERAGCSERSFLCVCFAFVFIILSCMFIAVLWSPAGKRMTSWLSCVWCFLVFSHFLTLVSRVRCGTWLYRFLILPSSILLLKLPSWCLVSVSVVSLFLTVPCVGLQCVIVVFPDHTYIHLWGCVQ